MPGADREFAATVGDDGPVTVTGLATRAGPVADARVVRAPIGVRDIQATEMIVTCGAGTPVGDLRAALADVGQTVALPESGTVGGALAVGHSDVDRLRYGPLRDALLQARYVAASGQLVTIGGPTVKNVSGFDMCRLFVGSLGTLGFLSEVTLRTRPLPRASGWWTSRRDPHELLTHLYRPAALLWDGTTTWVRLDGATDDLAAQAKRHDLATAPDPPPIPNAGRSSHRPVALVEATRRLDHGFLAEIGVGVVHHAEPIVDSRPVDAAVDELHHRIKERFDPSGRLNPGRSPLR
ncbi:MAG: FAD-binding protein [Actinomycetota bacterium]